MSPPNLGGHTSEFFAEPESISEDLLPTPSKYVIRTRIVIEGAMAHKPGDDISTAKQLWAIMPEEAIRQIKLAEEIYSDLNIEFHVASITFRSYTTTHLDHLVDGAIHRGILSIHYMLPNDFEYEGVSSGPWAPVDTGILLAFAIDDTTLAHEIGHWLGLLHPFAALEDGDMVDDTPAQIKIQCNEEENATPNCKNVMSYCDHENKFVTAGQLERMKKFLRAKRMGYVIPPDAGPSVFDDGLPEITSLDLNAS